MIDWSKPIETTDGLPARLVCRDVVCPDGYSCLVLYRKEWEEWPLFTKTDGTSNCGTELRNVKQKPREVWINMYPDGSLGMVNYIYPYESEKSGLSHTGNMNGRLTKFIEVMEAVDG